MPPLTNKENRVYAHPSMLGEGMTVNEIAKELGLATGTVRNILYTALTKLRLKALAREMRSEDYLEK